MPWNWTAIWWMVCGIALPMPRFSLRQGDVLELPLSSTDGVAASKVVANIPYNITGPLAGSAGGPTGSTGGSALPASGVAGAEGSG